MVCQNCGKALVRGYSFCMECGTPVPPEALAEAGMPPRTGDHAKSPTTEKTEAANTEPEDMTSGGMPDVKPLMSDGNEDEDTDGKTLAFCKNCGTVMQRNPDTCEKCGQPLAGSSNIPLFRNPDDDFYDNSEEDIDLNKMLGMGGVVEEDEMQAEAAKMFGMDVGETKTGVSNEIENQFSAADLELLTAQMSKYSQNSASQMPQVGINMPEPEPQPEPKPEIREAPKYEPEPESAPVIKEEPIIAETEFIIPESEFIGDTPETAVEPKKSAEEPKPAPMPEPMSVKQPDEPPKTDDALNRFDYPEPEELPARRPPNYLYYGGIILVLLITLAIILVNVT